VTYLEETGKNSFFVGTETIDAEDSKFRQHWITSTARYHLLQLFHQQQTDNTNVTAMNMTNDRNQCTYDKYCMAMLCILRRLFWPGSVGIGFSDHVWRWLVNAIFY